jgi:hypothetical protein
MPPDPLLILLFLAVKHFIADFLLQTRQMVTDKSRYGGRGGIQHAIVHGGLTLMLVQLLPRSSLALLAVLALLEVAVHYHIDWGKQYLLRRLHLGPGDGGFWSLFGLDQLLHWLFYIGMTWGLSMSV